MNRDKVRQYMKAMFDFHPAEYQIDFVYDCINHGKVVAVFARQSGKSEATSKLAIMFARRISSAPILIFAPTDRQAGLIAQKIQNSIGKMPYLTHFHVIRQTQREFYFNTGASIICMTTGDTGQTILGHTAGAIIEEEAGSIKDTIHQSVIMPMGATTNPPIVKIGTPKGKNHFYESSISPNFKLHQVDYTKALAAGIHTQAYVDEIRSTVTSDVWTTEMLAQFIEDMDAYFSYDLIESCVVDIKKMDKPEHEKIYVLGGDIAREGKDATTFVIIEVGEGDEPHRVVKTVEIAKSKLDYVVDEIIRLDDIWEFDKIFLDETGLGAGVIDFIGRMYNQRTHKQAKPDKMRDSYNWQDKVIGIKFTIQSKLDIFSNLKNLMEQGLMKYPRNEKMIAQLRDFRREITESQNVKLHHGVYGFDDYCDALALAAKGAVEAEGGVIIDF